VAWSLAELGEFDEAISSADDAVAIAESINQPYSMAAAYLASGQIYLLRGALEDAVQWLERAVGICRTWNLRVILPTTTGLLGLSYALNGQLDEALPMTEESESLSSAIRIFDTPMAITAASVVFLRCGRVDEAAQAAARIMELTSQRKLRGSHARALYTTATVNAISGAPDEARAERHFVEGLTLADELGMRPLYLYRFHLAFSRLWRSFSCRIGAASVVARESSRGQNCPRLPGGWRPVRYQVTGQVPASRRWPQLASSRNHCCGRYG
jgi:tetratricopeptide (TPR) repeat protein